MRPIPKNQQPWPDGPIAKSMPQSSEQDGYVLRLQHEGHGLLIVPPGLPTLGCQRTPHKAENPRINFHKQGFTAIVLCASRASRISTVSTCTPGLGTSKRPVQIVLTRFASPPHQIQLEGNLLRWQVTAIPPAVCWGMALDRDWRTGWSGEWWADGDRSKGMALTSMHTSTSSTSPRTRSSAD